MFFHKKASNGFAKKQNDKKSPKAHLRSLKTLRYEWSLPRPGGVKKANQCVCHGCDCGYNTDKLHRQPATRSMATTMASTGTMRTITTIMVRSAPR